MGMDSEPVRRANVQSKGASRQIIYRIKFNKAGQMSRTLDISLPVTRSLSSKPLGHGSLKIKNATHKTLKHIK